MMLDALRALDPVKKNVVHFFEKFQDQGHTCLVFEKLDMNLFTLLEQRQWEHLTLNEIRPIAHQVKTMLLSSTDRQVATHSAGLRRVAY